MNHPARAFKPSLRTFLRFAREITQRLASSSTTPATFPLFLPDIYRFSLIFQRQEIGDSDISATGITDTDYQNSRVYARFELIRLPFAD